MVYMVCRRINIVCAVLTSVLFLDLLVLPKIEKREKIVIREAEYHRVHRKYSGYTQVKSDTRLIITENYRYPIQNYQQFEYWQCDSIQLFSWRQKGDYGDMFDFTEEQLTPLFEAGTSLLKGD